MNKQTFTIPKGCKAISMEIIDNAIVTTFEHEKVEFKKGDFVFAEWIDEFSCIAIYSHADKYYHHFICKLYKDGSFEKRSNQKLISIGYAPRLATNTEKQLLFDALAKENKMWDAEKMEIVELKYISKNGNLYFYLDDEFKINNENWWNFEYDKRRFKVGNCFKTEAEAQKFRDYILKYEAPNN